MADIPNVCTVGVQASSEALHELKHSPDKRARREKPKSEGAVEMAREAEPAGEGVEAQEHQLDVSA